VNDPGSTLFHLKAIPGQFASVWHLRTHDDVVPSSNALCPDIVLIVVVLFSGFAALSR